MTSFPALLIDSTGKFLVALMSEDAVGVSARRFETVPSPPELYRCIPTERWISVNRESLEVTMITPHEEDNDVHLCTPQENESGQFAIELALSVWPEWGMEYREMYSPKQFILYPLEPIEA
jgi:hypothetical protein